MLGTKAMRAALLLRRFAQWNRKSCTTRALFLAFVPPANLMTIRALSRKPSEFSMITSWAIDDRQLRPGPSAGVTCPQQSASGDTMS